MSASLEKHHGKSRLSGAVNGRVDEEIKHLNEVDRHILLLLGAKNTESVRIPTHLQNTMYFIQNLFPKLARELNYEPGSFGPFSETLAKRVEEMEFTKLIKSKHDRIELTLEGKRTYNELKSKMSDDDIEAIADFKEFCNDLNRNELLVFMYGHETLKKNLDGECKEYKKILSKRVSIAIAMYKTGKISMQKAAQIAGKHLMEFIEELKRETN